MSMNYHFGQDASGGIDIFRADCCPPEQRIDGGADTFAAACEALGERFARRFQPSTPDEQRAVADLLGQYPDLTADSDAEFNRRLGAAVVAGLDITAGLRTALRDVNTPTPGLLRGPLIDADVACRRLVTYLHARAPLAQDDPTASMRILYVLVAAIGAAPLVAASRTPFVRSVVQAYIALDPARNAHRDDVLRYLHAKQ